nr:MAG TPA: hypothetical protein [Caudoviricetes sp.]
MESNVKYLGNCLANRLQAGNTIIFESRCFLVKAMITVQRVQRLGGTIIVSSKEINDVAFGANDYVELVEIRKADGA